MTKRAEETRTGGLKVRALSLGRSRRWLAPLGAALALASCGVVPTPAVPLGDVTLDLQPSTVALGRVIYVRQDVFSGTTLPSVLQALGVTGTATYQARGGTLRQVEVYVRSSLDALPGTCVTLGPAVACEAAGETAQTLGTVTLTAGQGTGFSLGGSALGAAARAGHGYFGVRAVQGDSLAGEQVRLTDLRARAKL